MSPQDHNRILVLIYGIIGILILAGLIIAAVLEVHRRPSDAAERLAWMLYLLPVPLLQIFTALGLFTRKKWGRILALVLSAFYVWVFPLGTLLAIYTWYVLYSETGRNMYGVTPSSEAFKD
jgi:hypothetical protein